jgi:hypothetical protein
LELEALRLVRQLGMEVPAEGTMTSHHQTISEIVRNLISERVCSALHQQIDEMVPYQAGLR